MSIFDRLFKKKVAAKTEYRNAIIQYFKTYPATKNPVVLSIIHHIANTVSTLGLDLYQNSKTGRYKVYNNISRLFEFPNQEDTATTFLYRQVANYVSTGNIYIQNINGYMLNLLPSERVTVRRSPEAPYSKIFSYGGNEYNDKEIIHIYNPQYYDGTIGHSPIEYNSDLITLHSALLMYMDSYFNNSAGEHLAITLAPELIKGLSDKAKKDEFEKFIQEKILGPLNAGKPLMLQPGMDMKNIKQTTNIESDLATLLDRVETQIARLFGFPQHLLTGDYGNNLQYQQIYYLQSCILGITEALKEKYNTVLPINDKMYMSFEFNYDNLLMPDTDTRHKIIREDIKGGILTINEGRKDIGREMYTGTDDTALGDSLWFMRNFSPVLEKNKDSYFQNAAPVAVDPTLTN